MTHGMLMSDSKLSPGDFVAYFHGMPVDTDYGVVLEARAGRYLCYDPFWGWEFHSALRGTADLQGIIKLDADAMEATRTNWEPHRDGKRFSHTVAEAVAYAKASGLFERRDKSEWWNAQNMS